MVGAHLDEKRDVIPLRLRTNLRVALTPLRKRQAEIQKKVLKHIVVGMRCEDSSG